MLRLVQGNIAEIVPGCRAIASWATVDPDTVSGSNVAQAYNLGAHLS
jgi:hypothetical protein